MPISTQIMLACLTVLRVLFWMIAVLLVLLGLKSLVDPTLTIGLTKALALAGGSVVLGWLAGWVKTALQRRAGL